jgi:formylglycine-generating enzyme required for sulfatase activity
MIETFISLLGTANTIHDSYNKISGIFRSKDNSHIEYLDRIATSIERLSDNILYAPNMETVRDITQNSQRKINNFREVKDSLEPVQRAVGSEILSSAIILTPDKMELAMQKSPWEVLMDIRPVNLSNPPNNPDMIPIVFEHDGTQYVGWQMRGTLPMLFDCTYDELLVPEIQVEKKKGLFERIFKRNKSSSNQQIKPGDIFRDHLKDGSEAPEMVLIPAGRFRMGDITGNGYEEEQPVHEVSVKSFAMGRYPVTVGEFKQFVNATGYKTEAEKGDGAWLSNQGWNKVKDANWRNPYFDQTDKHPVVCVSWNDAVAYTEWLSTQTGQQYHLPTEAEWEYAARAGTETDYWWGNDIDKTKANYNNNLGRTSPVGDYKHNPFGLYDILGNVWEWTYSEYEDKYNGKEKECISKNSNKNLVLRGGSWDSNPTNLRTAARLDNDPDLRNDFYGFRVVLAACCVD